MKGDEKEEAVKDGAIRNVTEDQEEVVDQYILDEFVRDRFHS